MDVCDGSSSRMWARLPVVCDVGEHAGLSLLRSRLASVPLFPVAVRDVVFSTEVAILLGPLSMMTQRFNAYAKESRVALYLTW